MQAMLFMLVSEGVCDGESLGVCAREAQNQIPD